MNESVDLIESVRGQLAALTSDVFSTHDLHSARDADLLETMRAVGDVQRLVEALLVAGVAEICARSDQVDRSPRLSMRMGCHNVNELVQRLTRCSPQTASRLEKAQRATGLDWDPITGDGFPARLPAMRDALADGEVGLDGIVAVAAPLLGMRDRVERSQVLAADASIAAFARGGGADDGPAACADLLRVQATVWACALDQDGDEPADRDTARARGFVLGRMRDGVIPFRGNAVPEVAGAAAAHLRRRQLPACA